MLDVVSSIYDMMGRFASPCIDEYTAKDHVEMVFQRMDANKDGVISVEEFMDTCRRVRLWFLLSQFKVSTLYATRGAKHKLSC